MAWRVGVDIDPNSPRHVALCPMLHASSLAGFWDSAPMCATCGQSCIPTVRPDPQRADRRSVRPRSRCIGWLLAIEDATVRGKLQFAVPDLMQRPKVSPAQLVG